MASSYIVQAGTTLARVSAAGNVTTLTLPAGVTLEGTKRLRGVVMGKLVVLAGSPSQNLTVAADNTVRVLCPKPPAYAVTLAAAAGGALTGTFNAKATFYVKDRYGNLLAESPFGPVSADQAVSGEWLKATNVPLSAETVSGRRLYRPTTGPGTVYYPWMDVGGNTVTSVQDDLSDAGLALVAAPTDLGMPPKYDLVVEWRNRLWGKTLEAPDVLYQGANGKPYAAPASRTFVIPAAGADDARGITGFLRRRDELGVGRSTALHKVIGDNENNFARKGVAESIGVWASDSCQVIDDIGYFFGNPYGVYTWSSAGVTSISNDAVKAWFETDTYFNRALFDQAVGFYNPQRHSYTLLLAAAGSTDLDRWVEYDIATKKWWGPHKTGAFTPVGAVTLRDANNLAHAAWLASDGKIYKPQATKTDGSSTAVDFDVTTAKLSGESPATLKTFRRPVITTKVQSGGTLTVTPTVGGLAASAGTAASHDMTKGHQELPRVGDGELLSFRLREATAGQDVVVYGIEVPFFEVAQR